MTAAELAREIALHRNRVVEIKANLHDLETQRASLLRECEDEEQVIATLVAVGGTPEPAPEAAVEPRPRRPRAEG